MKEQQFVRPTSYTMLSESEMQNTFGGSVHLPVSRDYLNREYCQGFALSLLGLKAVTGMTVLEVAQELYAHAVAYYHGATIRNNNSINSAVKNYLMSKGSVIDIEDGGDTAIRKAAYAVIWHILEIK